MKNKALVNFSIIPKDDPKQALRIRRFLMAFGAYALWCFLGYISYLSGFVEWKAVAGLLIIMSIINIVLYMAFRTGLNLKMADPSLTAIQMCAAILLVMYGMYFAHEARGVLLLIYVIILLFGIFHLNTRSFLYISVFILLTYGGVIVQLHTVRSQGFNFNIEYLQWVVLAIVLVTFSLIGGYISSLRTKISKDSSTIKNLTDNIHDVIFVLDMNLNYTYISHSVKVLRGYEPEEVLKQAPFDAITPSSLDLATRTLIEIMELEKIEHKEDISRTLQLEVRRKNGTAVWTETKFSFIKIIDRWVFSASCVISLNASRRNTKERRCLKRYNKVRKNIETFWKAFRKAISRLILKATSPFLTIQCAESSDIPKRN
jgi:PAS domain S-box-containing protein